MKISTRFAPLHALPLYFVFCRFTSCFAALLHVLPLYFEFSLTSCFAAYFMFYHFTLSIWLTDLTRGRFICFVAMKCLFFQVFFASVVLMSWLTSIVCFSPLLLRAGLQLLRSDPGQYDRGLIGGAGRNAQIRGHLPAIRFFVEGR